jgi:formate-dependent phosphoribosylglycinamide formyltransferase (GAR transformylase)
VGTLRSKATNDLKRTVHYQDRRRIEKAWQYAVEGSRGDVVEAIVEACQTNSEITLLTVVQNNNPTLFCAPIGHRQEGNQESWQPATILDKDLYEAKDMAEKVTEALVPDLGVEFFLADDYALSQNRDRNGNFGWDTKLQ